MSPEIPLEDAPTERFALQPCPHCDALTAVALCEAISLCHACGEGIEVAPPPPVRAKSPKG